MQFLFLKRLSTGLAIAAPMAYWFATAPMQDLAPRSDVASLAPSPASHVHLASADTEDSGKLVSISNEFETSELIWSGILPLNRQSADTIENVRISAEAVDMTAVRPNEVFSFNNVVGVRTEEKGYRPGLMYSNGEVVMGVGGGICIASTALYKAALESGLGIIERHPHSGPVSYADAGRDAAVSYGWADMRFKNNTGSMLLVRSVVRDDQLIVALYGTRKPGQTVEIVTEDYELIPYKVVEKEDVMIPEGETKVKQVAREGFAVTTVRLVKQNGKLVSREVVSRDTIMPRNKIVLVPPKRGELPAIALPLDAPTQQEHQSGTMSPLPLPESQERPAFSLPTSDLTDSTDSK